MDGCRESNLFDHTFVFPEVQEAFPRHEVAVTADRVADNKLTSATLL